MSRRYSDDDLYSQEDELSETARRSGQTSVRRTAQPSSRAQNRRAANQQHARGEMYNMDAIWEAQEQPEETYTSRLQESQKRRGSARETQNRQDRSDRTDRYARSNYSARSASSPHESTRKQAKKPGARKTKRIILIVALVVVVVAIGSVFGYITMINNNLHEGIDEDLQSALVTTDMANEPFYVLLLGTDGSAERDEDEEYAGGSYRSDTIILARIDAPAKKATLVSIHRDTRVDMGEYGVNKINAAYTLGGPSLAVETVSKMAGVPISHYVEIDFDAFCEMVDALGGVEVDVPVEIDDYDAGGTLHAGLQTLDGDQALILCRSRHTYEDSSTDPDMMRSANQRLVLSAIARKVLDSDIATIANAVGLMSSYVTTDLNVNDIIGLAQALQGLDPETDIYSAMEPAEGVYEDEIWWTVTKEDEWREMMRRVDAGLPPTESGQIDEKTGTVIATAGGEFANTEKTCWISVKNGTGKDGLAMSAATMLIDAGFVNTTASSANSDDYKETLIIYDDPSLAYEAQLIANTLGQGKVMVNDGDWFYEGDFLVIIGADWNPNRNAANAGSGGGNAGTAAAYGAVNAIDSPSKAA